MKRWPLLKDVENPMSSAASCSWFAWKGHRGTTKKVMEGQSSSLEPRRDTFLGGTQSRVLVINRQGTQAENVTHLAEGRPSTHQVHDSISSTTQTRSACNLSTQDRTRGIRRLRSLLVANSRPARGVWELISGKSKKNQKKCYTNFDCWTDGVFLGDKPISNVSTMLAPSWACVSLHLLPALVCRLQLPPLPFSWGPVPSLSL